MVTIYKLTLTDADGVFLDTYEINLKPAVVRTLEDCPHAAPTTPARIAVGAEVSGMIDAITRELAIDLANKKV